MAKKKVFRRKPELIPRYGHHVEIQAMLDKVSKVLNVNPRKIVSVSKKPRHAEAKCVFAAMIRMKLGLSYTLIGDYVGNDRRRIIRRIQMFHIRAKFDPYLNRKLKKFLPELYEWHEKMVREKYDNTSTDNAKKI